MPSPVPPHMLALRVGPPGSRVYPTLPPNLESSMPAANSCQFGAIAMFPARKDSSSAVQSQLVLPGCEMPTSFW
jgi:hypothetical protein